MLYGLTIIGLLLLWFAIQYNRWQREDLETIEKPTRTQNTKPLKLDHRPVPYWKRLQQWSKWRSKQARLIWDSSSKGTYIRAINGEIGSRK